MLATLVDPAGADYRPRRRTGAVCTASHGSGAGPAYRSCGPARDQHEVRPLDDREVGAAEHVVAAHGRGHDEHVAAEGPHRERDPEVEGAVAHADDDLAVVPGEHRVADPVAARGVLQAEPSGERV